NIYTNSSRALVSNSRNAMPASTVISNNVISWEPGAVAYIGMAVVSPAQLTDNTLNVRGTAGLSTAAAVSLLAIPGQSPPLARGNNVSVSGGQASRCFNVADPGSLYSDYIMISDNSCRNTVLGINVSNPGNTPNVSFFDNTIVSVGITYS